MTAFKAYSISRLSGCMHPAVGRFLILISFSLLLSATMQVRGQDLPEYDEIGVFLEIPRFGGWEIDALIKNEELYLPVTNLFDILKIKNEASPGFESIKGFFVNPEAEYLISRDAGEIKYQGTVYRPGRGDLIRTESDLYLKSPWFGKIFGMDCNFNFRSLSVTLSSRLELPLIREMRLEEMRRNLTRLQGDMIADTVIGRSYPAFRFGMADWSALATQEVNGRSDARLNLDLGAMIAGGEATASLYYNTAEPFSEKQQYYRWRYVNNDFAPLRQIIAGKIAANAISSLFSPVVGVQLTNTPTTYRRSFGTYLLSDRTEPGWIVELYVNNVLVNYVKADASGFFSFEVPLVYGNSMVRLKFYGPWGEERTREQNIVIPYNFLPANTLEYTVSAGMVEDTLHSIFSRGIVSYGLTRSITLGAGAEYLSSLSDRPVMPFLTASFRLSNNLLLSGEYTHGVRSRGTLSYRLPSNMQLDLNYTWYDKEQKAIFYNYREERKATLSIPLKLGKMNTYQRISLYQIVLPATNYTTGEWMISGSLFGINTNLSTYAMLLKETKPFFYSNLSMSFRLPGGFIMMPQVQYGYTENRFYSARARIEKHLLRNAYLTLSYEQNFRNNFRQAEAGFRYDFAFAQAGASVRQSNSATSFVQYARGSLINDGKTRYLGTDNRTNLGRGGISIVPFIDLNSNGIRDKGEPRAYGLNIRTNSGRIIKSERDTTIRIVGLEPYTYCFIEIESTSFDNIAWQVPKKSFSIAVDPNIMKLVEIPVAIAGEAVGSVSLEEAGIKRGIGRIIVSFSDSKLRPVGRTLTEADGYFSYFGLTPGKYFAQPDTVQLAALGMKSEPGILSFEISPDLDGDIVEGLDFTVRYTDTGRITAEEKVTPEKVQPPVIPEEAVRPVEIPERPPVAKDTTYMTIHEMTEEVYTITEDSWAIQIGAFRSRSYAEGFKNMLERELGKEVQITVAGDYFRVRVLDLKTREEVDEIIGKLNKLGFRELWIIRLLARQQQIVLVQKTDSLAVIRESPLSEAEIAQMQLDAFRLRTQVPASGKILTPPSAGREITGFRAEQYRLKTPDQPILDRTILDAMEDYIPEIGKFEFRNEWSKPVLKGAIPAESIAEREPVIVMKAPVRPYQSVRVSPGIAESLIPIDKALPDGSATIALQVAIFHKESQALRAKKRIESRLDVTVEIVKQWDYYHVLVTGFYTREETYQYYPELAGMGYPGITLIENYRRQK